MSIPDTMRALVIETLGEPPVVKSIPVPNAVPGSAVVRVLSAVADPVLPKLITGKLFSLPTPFIPGNRAIGRVVATARDATSLKAGQLVVCDPFIRSRDNPHHELVWGVYPGPSTETKKFMADNWSAGAYAEYMRAPLENCHPLNEALLTGSVADGGLGYTIEELNYLATALIPFGGLRSINLQAGERIIVAPATGMITGAAVHLALAIGAQVIAVGRNQEILRSLQDMFGPARVKVYTPTGDVERDTAALQQWGAVDKYIDISPHAATGTTHVRSAVLALRQYGQAAIMGAIMGDLNIPYYPVVERNLTIRGRYMFERDDVRALVKMVESGAFKLGGQGGQEVSGKFGLGDLDAVFESLKKNKGPGQMTLITPQV